MIGLVKSPENGVLSLTFDLSNTFIETTVWNAYILIIVEYNSFKTFSEMGRVKSPADGVLSLVEVFTQSACISATYFEFLKKSFGRVKSPESGVLSLAFISNNTFIKTMMWSACISIMEQCIFENLGFLLVLTLALLEKCKTVLGVRPSEPALAEWLVPDVRPFGPS